MHNTAKYLVLTLTSELGEGVGLQTEVDDTFAAGD